MLAIQVIVVPVLASVLENFYKIIVIEIPLFFQLAFLIESNIGQEIRMTGGRLVRKTVSRFYLRRNFFGKNTAVSY